MLCCGRSYPPGDAQAGQQCMGRLLPPHSTPYGSSRCAQAKIMGSFSPTPTALPPRISIPQLLSLHGRRGREGGNAMGVAKGMAAVPLNYVARSTRQSPAGMCVL